MKHRIWTILKLLAIPPMAYLLLKNFDVESSLEFFDGRVLGWMLLVQPLMLGNLLTLSLRFARLVQTPPSRLLPTMKAVALSHGFNAVLPARMAEFLRPIYLRDHLGIPMGTGLAALFLDRLCDLIVSLSLALGCALLFLPDSPAALFGVSLSLMACGLFFFPLLSRKALPWISRIPWTRVRLALQSFVEQAAEKIHTKNFWHAFAVGLSSWVFIFVASALFLHYAGSPAIGIPESLAVFAVTSLAGAIPLLPGGFLTYEAAAVIALKQLNCQVEHPLALAISLHLMQIGLTFVLALSIMVREKLGLANFLSQIRPPSPPEEDPKPSAESRP